jgi:hypothetical protein
VSSLAVGIERHPVRWLTAAPLWSTLLASADPTADELDRMQRPSLLRMESDDFMDELAALLADDPDRVAALEAKPTSYRAAPPGAEADYAPPIDHVKLYQPVHGHFNLVAATLVCRVAGLPDKAVDAGAEETAGFVMRRTAESAELAWDGTTWTAVEDPAVLGAGEQVAAMFPVQYPNGDRTRRLFVGLVPTSSLESFKSGSGAVSFSPQPGDRTGPPPDRRREDFDTVVTGPLEALSGSLAAGTGVTDADRIEPSRFLLLDLGDFLLRHAPLLWDAVQSRTEPAAPALATAFRALRDTKAEGDMSWLDALRGVWAERDRIWGEAGPPPAFRVNLARTQVLPTDSSQYAQFRQALLGALPARTPDQMAEPQPPFDAPKLDPRPATRYVIRCVYRRPRCGPLHPDVVSDPSRPFAVAGFFDLDAPSRPLNVVLPFDTSIAGLRKAPKNVSFLISRELRTQLDRVRDGKKALDGQLEEGVPVELGMICAFSIPIITIAALLLLTIIVFVLNIVFWWLPFLKICFPVPLKGRD